MLCAAPAGAAQRIPAGAKVASVRIEGATSFAPGFLGSLMRLRPTHAFLVVPRRHEFYRDFLRADVQALRSFYIQHGFPAVVVQDSAWVRPRTDPPLVDILIRIDEGERETLEGLHFLGVRATPPDVLREQLVLQEGKPFTDLMVKVDRETIKNWYYEHGFPWAQVEADQEIPREVTFFVDEHARARFGVATVVDSLDTLRTKPRVIVRNAPFAPGDLFRSSQLAEYERRLYATELFSSVTFALPGEAQTDSTHRVNVLVSVTERPSRYVEGGLDYDATGAIVGTASAGSRNVGGLQRRWESVAEVGLSGTSILRRSGYLVRSSSVKLAWTEPWFVLPRTQASVVPYYGYTRTITNQAQRTTKAGARLELVRQLARQTRLTSNFSNEWLWQYDDLSVVDAHASQNRSLDMAFDGDYRDQIFTPTRGTAVHASIAYSGLGGKTNFMKGVLEQSWFTQLKRRVVLGVRVRGGAIAPLGADVFPDTCGLGPLDRADLAKVDEPSRFVLGGATTVRGYAEQIIGANNPRDPKFPCTSATVDTSFGQYKTGGLAELLLNVELRVTLSARFGVAFYVDGGNVWPFASDILLGRLLPTTSRLENYDMKYSAGAGLRIATPVGPVRFDYARKIGIPAELAVSTQDRARDRLQFAIGPSF